MTVPQRHPDNVRALRPVAPSELQVGTVCSVDMSGCARVDYPGNSEGPLPARTTLQVRSPGEVIGAAVLLAFEGGDRTLPVIVGLLRDRIICEPLPEPAAKGLDVVVDGKHVQLEAQEELQLRCGKGSITLTRDGRIVAKGTDIVSRAARSQKIKGACVNIN